MNKNLIEFIKYLKLEKRYSGHTIESYQNDLLQFESFLLNYFNSDKIFWHLVDKKIIRYFMINLQENKISRRSVARKLAALKSFFKFLVREEIIAKNPTITIKTPKFDKKLPEFLSIEEMEDLLHLPEHNTFEGIRDLALLELFYGTGIRLSELINMKLSNILINENLIRVIGKGQKERVVPLANSPSICREFCR
ncbi:MAG: site-specific integrase [Calditrichaceae bacterium]